MKSTITLIATLLLMPMSGLYATDTPLPADGRRSDRHALVTRHNIEWNDPAGNIPLGNGEFCFTADGTGLQTFGGNSMAHWAWHSFPLPAGWTRDYVLKVDGWAKDRDPNTAFSTTVEPLPFHGMSVYPYPAKEHFPNDPAHEKWRREYNTRPALRLMRPLTE